MPYEQKIWVSGEIINTDELNNMEQGIADAHDAIEIVDGKLLNPEVLIKSVFTDQSVSASSSETSGTFIVDNANMVVFSVNNAGPVDVTAKVYFNYMDGGSFDTDPMETWLIPSGEQHSLTTVNSFYSFYVIIENSDEASAATVSSTARMVYHRFDDNGVNVYDADNDGIIDQAASVPWNGVTGKPSLVESIEKGVANGVAELDDTGKVPTEQLPVDAVGNDENAIHTDTSNEINSLSEKSSADAADVVIIEDSSSFWEKKKISIEALQEVNIDGGTPLSVFTVEQIIDGGSP